MISENTYVDTILIEILLQRTYRFKLFECSVPVNPTIFIYYQTCIYILIL